VYIKQVGRTNRWNLRRRPLVKDAMVVLVSLKILKRDKHYHMKIISSAPHKLAEIDLLVE
jgi:hypothetical protein